MTAEKRRKAILETLKNSDGPCNASALAETFGVSRQVIVTDIALLRAGGASINATPRGYLLECEEEGIVRRVVCWHTSSDAARELNLIVDHGCAVLDVVVEHPVYGEITGALQLKNRYDVALYIAKATQTTPLSLLTGGVHLHTLSCPNEEAFQRVCEALKREKLLIET